MIAVLRRTVVCERRFDNICGSHPQTQDLTLKIASAQVVETSLANNSPSQDSNHPDDRFQPRYVAPGFKLFAIHSLGIVHSE